MGDLANCAAARSDICIRITQFELWGSWTGATEAVGWTSRGDYAVCCGLVRRRFRRHKRIHSGAKF